MEYFVHVIRDRRRIAWYRVHTGSPSTGSSQTLRHQQRFFSTAFQPSSMAEPGTSSDLLPILEPAGGTWVQNSYIVKLKNDHSKNDHLGWLRPLLAEHNSEVTHGDWDPAAFHGYAGEDLVHLMHMFRSWMILRQESSHLASWRYFALVMMSSTSRKTWKSRTVTIGMLGKTTVTTMMRNNQEGTH